MLDIKNPSHILIPSHTSMSFTQVMVWCAPALLSYTLVAVGVLGLGTMTAFFAGSNAWAGIVTLIVTLTAILYFHQLKQRLAFASANIKVACAAIWDSPPVLVIGLGLLACQVCSRYVRVISVHS